MVHPIDRDYLSMVHPCQIKLNKLLQSSSRHYKIRTCAIQQQHNISQTQIKSVALRLISQGKSYTQKHCKKVKFATASRWQ